MQTETIVPATLSVFQTFDGYRTPESLHVQSLGGDSSLLADLPHLGLAIVGTRHPQKRSLELLAAVMRDLRGSGLVILSGFARGIDSAAHELAVENGLRTIAILGCGIDIDYPRENRELRHRILGSGGLILSPYSPGTPPLPRNFIERNGLIAGFSRAVWVVEAAAVSGTLNTATWATRFNRHLYATSCFPGDAFFEGNEKLLGQRRTDAYPVAEAFFGAHSLGSCWPHLGIETQAKIHFPPPGALTVLQRQVLELEGANGECREQALLHASQQAGVTPGKFFLQLEEEIAAGRITREEDGRIKVRKETARPAPTDRAQPPTFPESE